MNYSDRKYRQNIDNLINKSLSYVLNEVNNTQQNQNQQGQQQTPNYFGNEYRFTKGTWSLDKDKVNQPFGQNDEEGYNINPDDYTVVKINPRHSGWSVVTARNGYQAWRDTKNKLHPAITQLGWFDKCSDFNGRPNDKGTGGIFKNKEKRHYAIGLKDNRAYKVYADGNFEPYANYHNYSMVDAQGNKTTGNYYNEGMINSDGTYTTSFIQNPNNKKEFDPNKFLRIRFDDRTLLQKFFYIWGNTMNNSNRGNYLKVGYNDNGGQDVYYFIDMPNGPGIYDYVISLYDNLKNGTIKYNEIDKKPYRDTRSQTPGKRQNPYNISVPNEPANFTRINEDVEQQNNNSDDYLNNQYQDEQQSKERPDIIVFGNRIEGEDNTIYKPNNNNNNTDIQPGQDDQFYGLYTNPHTQKQFYYRFTKTPELDENGNVVPNGQQQYNVYIGNDPYQAQTQIGKYELQLQNDVQVLCITTNQGNIYQTIFPQDINNSKKSYPVTSPDGTTNYGTMHLWYPTNDPYSMYQGGLLEKQIKKITKKLINEYIYGKTM